MRHGTYKLEDHAQAELPFPPRKELRDGAEVRNSRRQVLEQVHSRGVGIVEKVEKFEHALNLNVIADGKRLHHPQIHVNEVRRYELIASRFQIARVVISVAVLIDRGLRLLRVVETALCPEDRTEFEFPGQFDQRVHLVVVTNGKVGRPLVKVGSVIELASLWNPVTVASEESGGCIRASLAGAARGNVPGVGNHRWHTDKAVRGIADASEGGIQAGAQGIVPLVGQGIAASHGEVVAHSLLERENARVVQAGVPRPKAV